MDARPLVAHILADEALTRGLSDPEARVLVEWLVDLAEGLADDDDSNAWERLRALCRRARAVGRFVHLWCYAGRRSRGAAIQLAAAERFTWPLPTIEVEPAEMMAEILTWEGRELAARAARLAA